ncbi:disulfide bond formation protein B [Limnohabitans sp. Jir72]|uniref:disulfide bond formation protein B n=1 Tax=Limnohabitans sp. Jir72 TaxID=1977909 RepID=UPI000D3639B0|nr:disulfide bond formation protein B [Limnohabitans sp. Jir72]PUE36057.1 disulfide bond formation protein B [Limnohabitans sp. Jir72]
MKLFSISFNRWMLLIALSCIGMLAFGLYLQHVVGLNPCPMCIVQRYALIGVMLIAWVGSRLRKPGAVAVLGVLLALMAGFGAFVAARQSWLQWYPPEIVTCGRDFYGMVENFPINRAIPMIFKGSGDCTKVDWTFLGGSIANWSFVAFVGFALMGLLIAVQVWRSR